MIYKVNDLIEFKRGHPDWVQHDVYSDRWVSWKIYESHNNIRLESKYALICYVESPEESRESRGEAWKNYKYFNREKNEWEIVDDKPLHTFYRVLYNDLYCLVKDNEILRKIN